MACDMCWQAILEVLRFNLFIYVLFLIWHGKKPSRTRKEGGGGENKPLRGRSAAPVGVNDFMFPA